MADEDEKSATETGNTTDAAFTASGVPRRKKRPATLDLEATEISSEQPTGAGGDDAAAAAGSRAETAPGDQETEATADASSETGPSPDKLEDQTSLGEDQPEPVVPAPARGLGIAAIVGAGLFGGLSCAAAVMLLAYSGMLPGLNDNMAIESRLAEIDSRLDTPAPGPDLGPVEAELKSLGERLKATEALNETVGSLAAQVRAAEDAANQARADMAGLSETLAGIGNDGDAAAAIASLSQQIAALKDDMSQLARTAGEQASNAAKDAEIEALRQRVGELEREPREDIVAARGAAAATAASALTLGALERAVLEGRSYRSELDAARALSGPDPAFAELERHASRGVARRAALSAEFDALADDIVAAEKPAGDGSVLSQIVERATSIVQVRPVGYVDGDDAAAAVARAEVALQEGDLEGALSELGMLKGEPKELAADFVARVEARLGVERAVEELTARTLTKLNDMGAAADPAKSGETTGNTDKAVTQ